MAVGRHGRTGVLLTVKMVIKQETASVPGPHPPTVEIFAVERIAKRGTAPSAVIAWRTVIKYAQIR